MASVVAAMVEGKPRVGGAAARDAPGDAWSHERDSLLSRLLDSVKQCQIRFGKKQTLATEAEAQVICLLTNLEAALCHGLKAAPASAAIAHVFRGAAAGSAEPVGGANALWTFVKTFLGPDEVTRFETEQRHVTTEIGRARSWLRTALNENALERYLYCLVNDATKLETFYEKWSFMRDQEKSSVLPSMAAGLKTILFNVTADAIELNQAPRGQPSEARAILNAMPIGGMLRDAIESSLPNTPATGSFMDSHLNENYLEPVIVESRGESNSGKTKVQGAKSTDDAKPTKKTSVGGKKKKKTVAHIVHLDGDGDVGKKRSNVVAPTTDDIRDAVARSSRAASIASTGSSSQDVAATPETTEGSAVSTPPRRISEPPADLPLVLTSSASEKNKTSKDPPGKSSIAPPVGDELRFVCGKGDRGVMSPVTPNSKSICISSANDGDSSDAISVTSTGQTSVVSSTTSDVSYPNGFPAHAPAGSGAGKHPTLLSLHSERLSGLRRGGEASSTGSVDAGATPDLSAFSTSELKEAIVSIMQRKDEVSEQNAELLGRLETLQHENGGLHDEVERLERKLTETDAKFATKSKFLERENELLKHQLKKYVGAVQVLERQQSSEASSSAGTTPPTLEQQLADSPAAIRSHAVDADAEQIRRSYEQKLIQVSEMHSDLMEFNDQLVVQMKQKDRMIEQLKSELEDLRGPLPADFADNADAASLASDAEIAVSNGSSPFQIPSSSSTCSFRALVNIWIPSAFLQTTNKDTFHVYQVYVRIRDEEWNVYRRYAQFYDLHKSMKKSFSDIGSFHFPPKKALGNKDEQFVEDRRVRLQQYLRQLLNYLTQCTGYELAHAHPITKERLLSALPFFSDRAPTSESAGAGRPSPSSLKSRSRLRTAEEPTTPLYMGL